MSKHVKYEPKHRALRAPSAPKKALRTTVMLSSVAVVATGATVGGSVWKSSPSADSVAANLTMVDEAQADTQTDPQVEVKGDATRDVEVSRSDRRTTKDGPADPDKQLALNTTDTGTTEAFSEDLSDNDPRDIAKALLSEYGFGSDQFGCLDSLYNSESGWRVNADNPTSSAYGIPQALPGSKMSSAGSDWATNPVTQIRWGLGYIEDRYGTPCSAWSFKQGNNWY